MTLTRMSGRRRFMLMMPATFALSRQRVSFGAAGARTTAASPAGALPNLGGAPTVTPGHGLSFPYDEGSHPAFRIEWWYVTGWLVDAAKHDLGFQITFFRTRIEGAGGNPSRFAPTHLIVAHAALGDPRRGKLVHAQQAGRAAFGLAAASEGMTEVRIGKWSLRSVTDERLRAVVLDRELRLELDLQRTQPPLLQGDNGFSRKGPSPASASYYYTLPQLAVSGTIATGATSQTVNGIAWLDHEWSSAYMEPGASGWDWIGINLDDGGALMAFQMRDAGGATIWSGATLRRANGSVESFAPTLIHWAPTRGWKSSRTNTTYPIAWRVDIGQMVLLIEPLMDDQEQDARASTGTIYWEGAVTATSGGRNVGRGYLELTGYWRALTL